MRIPIPWVILLAIISIALPAWLGTRNADFLTPPDDATLEALRVKTKTALPRIGSSADAISPQGGGARVIAGAPSIELGETGGRPAIHEYADRVPRGTSHLIELANQLETEGHPQRALLAWERVIDSCPATQEEIQVAFDAVARLRPGSPPWRAGNEDAPAIVIHAGTGEKSAQTLTPILAQVASDLAQATGGMLTVTAKVNAGPNIDIGDAPVPVAIWLTGSAADAISTDVHSFTVATPETLEYDVHRTVYQILQTYFAESPTLKPPADPSEEGDPRAALGTRLTRLHWQFLGESLNSKENSQTNE